LWLEKLEAEAINVGALAGEAFNPCKFYGDLYLYFFYENVFNASSNLCVRVCSG